MQKYINIITKAAQTIRQHVYPVIPTEIGEAHTRAHVRRAITRAVTILTVGDIAYAFYQEWRVVSDPNVRRAQRAKLDALDRHFKTNGYGGWFW